MCLFGSFVPIGCWGAPQRSQKPLMKSLAALPCAFISNRVGSQLFRYFICSSWITAAFKFFFCSKFQLKKRKKQFLKNELKWLPLTVKWWNEVHFTIKLQHFIFMNDIFCSTSLPLASNRWVRLTFSSLCPLF